MSDFNVKETVFWGAVATVTALLKNLIDKKISNKQGEKTMEQEKLGIKETKEALDGLNSLSEEIVSLAKDGIQMGDAVKLAEDIMLKPEFKAKLAAAIEGIQKVPAEIKDIDFAEGIELAQFEYEGVKKILEALKK